MAAKFAKFVFKSALAGSLIYATVNVANSMWITPNYAIPRRDNRMYFHKQFEENDEAVSPEIFKETWNHGIHKLLHGLLIAPDALKELSDRAFTKLKNSYKTSDK